MSKAVERIVDGRRGRGTIRLNFDTREVEFYSVAGILITSYSFESIHDLADAFCEAQETLIRMEPGTIRGGE